MNPRFYTLKDYPCPDEDDAGNLILWDDGGNEDEDGEAVVVMPCTGGWEEQVGVEPSFGE